MQDLNSLPPWATLVPGALALCSLAGAMLMSRRKRLIDGLPTCSTTGVFIGLVEVKGTAESERPLVSHLAGVRCVHYSWTVEERWSRTVTETYKDSKGETQTRTRTESGWTTVASGADLADFYLRDDEGVLLVRPEGAKLEPATVFSETCGPADPLYYAKGPAGAVPHSDHRRQFREVAIPLHSPVYVVGQARERADVVAPEIAADKEAPLFLVSTRTEEKISRGYAWKTWGLVFLALLFGGATGVIGLIPWWPRDDQAPVRALIGAGVFVVPTALAWVWMAYNSLIDLRNRVASAWSQVDVQLKRRHDLIPRLEAMVQGLQQHERDVQERLAALRSQREATPPGVAGPDHRGLRREVVALAENYPQLTASPAFLELQRQLADTEERIALARGYYNEIATHYNTRLEVVPDRFIASAARLLSRPLMAAADFERAAVRVQLAA